MQPLVHATGGFLQASKQAVVCGGEISVPKEVSNKCYTPGNPASAGTMSKKRNNAASVVLPNDRLWITGKSIKSLLCQIKFMLKFELYLQVERACWGE